MGGILLCTCKINLFLQLKHSQSVMFICYSNLIYSKRKKESMKIFPLLQSNSFLKREKKKEKLWTKHLDFSLMSGHVDEDLLHCHWSFVAFPLTLHHFLSDLWIISLFLPDQTRILKKNPTQSRSRSMNWAIRGSVSVSWEIFAVIKEGYIKGQNSFGWKSHVAKIVMILL